MSTENRRSETSPSMILVGIMALLPLAGVTKGVLSSGQADSAGTAAYPLTYQEAPPVEQVLPQTYTKMQPAPSA